MGTTYEEEGTRKLKLRDWRTETPGLFTISQLNFVTKAIIQIRNHYKELDGT